MRSDAVVYPCRKRWESHGKSDIFEAPPATSEQPVLFLPQLETQLCWRSRFRSNHACNSLKTWRDLLVSFFVESLVQEMLQLSLSISSNITAYCNMIYYSYNVEWICDTILARIFTARISCRLTRILCSANRVFSGTRRFPTSETSEAL